MARKQNKKGLSRDELLRKALEKFELEEFKKWMKKFDFPLWKSFQLQDEITQMATMCKVICNRYDMLGTEAHKKAIRWLKEHDMKGRLF